MPKISLEQATRQIEDLIDDRKSFITSETEPDSPFYADITALKLADRCLRLCRCTQIAADVLLEGDSL